MAIRCGSSSLTAVLAVAGLVGLGVAGYRMVGGCGSCCGEADANVVATSATEGACPLGCSGEKGAAANVTLASETTEAADCCAAQSACCEAKTDECCAEKVAGCCESEGADIEKVAETKTDGCCSDKKAESGAEKVASSSKN